MVLQVYYLIGKNLPLTCIWDISPSYQSAVAQQLPEMRVLSQLEVFTGHTGHPLDLGYTYAIW